MPQLGIFPNCSLRSQLPLSPMLYDILLGQNNFDLKILGSKTFIYYKHYFMNMARKKTKSTLFHDNIAEKYESSYTDPYWQLYFKVTWHNLEKYLPKKKKANILDAGGGTGLWSRKLAKLGFNLICTDIAQKMLDVGIKQAKKEKLSNQIEFKNVDITNMKCFKDNSFDMVIAQGDPVGYCGNSQKAIKELSRVTKREHTSAFLLIVLFNDWQIHF